jgi:hypothetical protein
MGIVLMLASAAMWAQCLAVFSTIVAEKFNKLRLLNLRALACRRYCNWRALPAQTTKMLAKFVRERTPERNPDLQLVLPANPRPQDFAEYERKIFNALNPLVRKDYRMKLFAHHVENAPVLSWLAPFKRAVRETVQAAKFEVYTPGNLLFESHDKTKDILLLTAGQVSIEYEEEEETAINLGSFKDQNAKAIAAGATAIKDLLQLPSPSFSDTDAPTPADSDASSADGAPPATKAENRVTWSGLGVVTEEPPQENGSRKDLPPRPATPGAESFETAWDFASKVLEHIDAQMDLDFSGEEDSKLMPFEEAPCVFGENSLWFADTSYGFSARSVNYTELLRIPTSTLIQLTKSDPRVKIRFQAFRQAVKQFEFATR